MKKHLAFQREPTSSEGSVHFLIDTNYIGHGLNGKLLRRSTKCILLYNKTQNSEFRQRCTKCTCTEDEGIPKGNAKSTRPPPPRRDRTASPRQRRDKKRLCNAADARESFAGYAARMHSLNPSIVEGKGSLKGRIGLDSRSISLDADVAICVMHFSHTQSMSRQHFLKLPLLTQYRVSQLYAVDFCVPYLAFISTILLANAGKSTCAYTGTYINPKKDNMLPDTLTKL